MSAAIRAEVAAPAAVPLTEPFAVTLTVTGPAPLEVAAFAWDAGPALVITDASTRSDAGVWQCTYHLDPRQPGTHALTWPALRVRAGSADWVEVRPPPQSVEITTTLPRADLSLARPIRPRPSAELPFSVWPWLLAVALLALLFRRRDRLRTAPWPELDRLARARLAHRLGLPSAAVTTPELVAALGSRADAADWAAWLDEADRHKFSPASGPVDASALRGRVVRLFARFGAAKQ